MKDHSCYVSAEEPMFKFQQFYPLQITSTEIFIFFVQQCCLFFAFVGISSAQLSFQTGVNSFYTTARPVVRPVYQVTRTKTYSGSDDGQYHPDDSGAYHPDGSGAYVHNDDPYKHINGPNGGSAGGTGGNGGYGPVYKGDSKIFNTYLIYLIK